MTVRTSFPRDVTFPIPPGMSIVNLIHAAYLGKKEYSPSTFQVNEYNFPMSTAEKVYEQALIAFDNYDNKPFLAFDYLLSQTMKCRVNLKERTITDLKYSDYSGFSLETVLSDYHNRPSSEKIDPNNEYTVERLIKDGDAKIASRNRRLTYSALNPVGSFNKMLLTVGAVTFVCAAILGLAINDYLK